MQTDSSRRRPFWVRAVLEAAVVVLVLGAIMAWQQRDLLPADERSLAPPFELHDLQGQRWDGARLQGKPAVLYFFAPWCGVCAASSHQLRWFERLAGDEVQLLMIGLDWQRPEELADYAARHSLANPVLLGSSATAVDYRVRGYPTYYVLDSRGRIAARDMGFTTVAGLWLRTLGL